MIYLVYTNSLGSHCSNEYLTKASINNLEENDLDAYHKDDGIILHRGAITYSDALIKGSETLPTFIESALRESGKPILEFSDDENSPAACVEFYNSLTEETVEG